MSKSETIRVLEHAYPPVHRFIGAPADLPAKASEPRLRTPVLASIGRRAHEELVSYGDALNRLQKVA